MVSLLELINIIVKIDLMALELVSISVYNYCWDSNRWLELEQSSIVQVCLYIIGFGWRWRLEDANSKCHI